MGGFSAPCTALISAHLPPMSSPRCSPRCLESICWHSCNNQGSVAARSLSETWRKIGTTTIGKRSPWRSRTRDDSPRRRLDRLRFTIAPSGSSRKTKPQPNHATYEPAFISFRLPIILSPLHSSVGADMGETKEELCDGRGVKGEGRRVQGCGVYRGGSEMRQMIASLSLF